MYIFTYIQHPLTSGPGGAPAGQPLQVPGGKALSQPRQRSTQIELGEGVVRFPVAG